jgi:leader peptidase (prepilin peptidase)/N-methyltransferase
MIITFVIIFGIVFGSFLNVLIYRIPNKMNIAFPNSHCPNCQTPLKWYDNIPILSYIILLGKCRYCKEKISIQYFLVELIAPILVILAYIKFNISVTFFIIAIASLIFIVIFAIDLKTKIIPDSMNYSLIILGLGYSIYELVSKNYTFSSLLSKGIGFAFILVFLLIIFLFYKFKKIEIFGMGDIKLLIGINLLIGGYNLILGFFLAAFIGLIFAIPSIKKKEHEIPYGPSLILAYLICIYFGTAIIDKLFMGLIG